jgi:hypothetical protein
MMNGGCSPVSSTLIADVIENPRRELLDLAQIRLTAHQIARLQLLAYRNCPRRTLPPLPSLQLPLPAEGGSRGK